MVPRFLLILSLAIVAAGEDPPTVSPSVFHAIVCRHHYLSGGDDCSGQMDDQGRDSDSTDGLTIPSVPSVHVSVHVSMSVGSKVGIAVGVCLFLYIVLVVVLKFRLGLTWSKALALGINAGQLSARCHIYVYPRPNDEVAVSEV